MRRWAPLLAAVLVLLLGVYLFTPRGPVPEPVAPLQSLAWSDLPEVPAPIKILKGSTITARDVAVFREAAPSKNQVWLELETNPPSSSQSRFELYLDLLFQAATENLPSATVFLEELRACAWNDVLHLPARAECLEKAEAIAQEFPALRDEFATIRRMISPELLEVPGPVFGGTGP